MRASTIQIAELGIQGCRPAKIAEQLGIRVERVYHAFRTARRNGIDVPKYGTTGMRHTETRVKINPALRGVLAPHAATRGLKTGELAQLILRTVAEDGLIDAVLDDGGANAS